MTATEEWTPQTACQLARERRARIAAAAKREAPIAVVAEPAPVAPPVEDEPTPRPPMPTWREMMSGRPEPTVLAIQAAVADDFGMTLNDMVMHRRVFQIVLARHVAMYLCHVLTRNSSVAIAQRFDGRDHTTVLHAVRRIKRLIQTDADLAARIERIRARLTMAGDVR